MPPGASHSRDHPRIRPHADLSPVRPFMARTRSVRGTPVEPAGELGGVALVCQTRALEASSERLRQALLAAAPNSQPAAETPVVSVWRPLSKPASTGSPDHTSGRSGGLLLRAQRGSDPHDRRRAHTQATGEAWRRGIDRRLFTHGGMVAWQRHLLVSQSASTLLGRRPGDGRRASELCWPSA